MKSWRMTGEESWESWVQEADRQLRAKFEGELRRVLNVPEQDRTDEDRVFLEIIVDEHCFHANRHTCPEPFVEFNRSKRNCSGLPPEPVSHWVPREVAEEHGYVDGYTEPQPEPEPEPQRRVFEVLPGGVLQPHTPHPDESSRTCAGCGCEIEETLH